MYSYNTYNGVTCQLIKQMVWIKFFGMVQYHNQVLGKPPQYYYDFYNARIHVVNMRGSEQSWITWSRYNYYIPSKHQTLS